MEKLEKVHQALTDQGSELMPLDDYGFSKKFSWVSSLWGFLATQSCLMAPQNFASLVSCAATAQLKTVLWRHIGHVKLKVSWVPKSIDSQSSF